MSSTEHKDRLAYLLQQYAVKKTGTEEEEELYVLIEGSDDETLKNALLPILENSESLAEFDEKRWRPMMERIVNREEADTHEPIVVSMKPGVKLWKRIAVAASVLLVVGLGSYFMFSNRETKVVSGEVTQEERFKNDVNPGGYKARLTLADGSIIILDSVVNGELTKQGGTVVVNKDGQLVYEAQNKSNEVLYNTLSTARGETYTTVLADGSKVWLNSASSIKYPVAFVGNERKIEITGEAYFEIAKHDLPPALAGGKKGVRMPFIVSANNKADVTVLGTHFNVNAYDDESEIKVTLLEGSVKVSNNAHSKIIKPGQQAVIALSTGGKPGTEGREGSPLTIHHSPDLEQVMAWKNGSFYFNSADLESIMRQVVRWYDVEVAYTRKINTRFNGEVKRDVKLSDLLKAMELSGGVQFEIDGKKILVK